MSTPTSSESTLDPKAVQNLVTDLFKPNPGIYWADLLTSAAIGWGAFWAVIFLEDMLWAKPLLALVAILALFRCLFFIHEITHFNPSDLPYFKAAWNALVGIPLMVPSFMYESVHLDHHRKDKYGTKEDPEYMPLARGSRLGLILFILKPFLFPVFFALRGLVLAPLAILVPPLHLILEKYASSLVINERYARHGITEDFRIEMKFVEVLIAIVGWSAVYFYRHGDLPETFLRDWYLMLFGVGFINHVRTLVAHRYQNDGASLEFEDQLRDSVTVEGSWWTEAWAPVGARYHALHHYLPKMPYHSLAEAHRRIKSAFPHTTSYQVSTEPSFLSAWSKLWQAAGHAPSEVVFNRNRRI